MNVLANHFHPIIQSWFTHQFGSATPVQTGAWQAIANKQNTLMAAPTGSGKTLAAFLAVIDELFKQGMQGQLTDSTYVLYISPLKALSNDIQKNLQHPLNGIRDTLLQNGMADIDIRANVRTGDTSQSERDKMRRNHPHILVTTPESVFILLTSESGREMLSNVRYVIVDEIHALAGNKRGAHTILSLERLQQLCLQKQKRVPIRIGISATQKPISHMANFLNGNHPQEMTIVDTGHQRKRDLKISLPQSPIESIMSNEVWDEIYNKLATYIEQHRTTLIFVNTRRLAERAAFALAERLGEEHVTAHHGSLSRKHRLKAEQQLKSGELKAIVATASLELGIDIGDIDLVCQLGSPRAIATFLQRVGRAGHAVNAIPKGRLFPLAQNDLLECSVLINSINNNELDQIIIPHQPLDVLAQHIIAEVANREWDMTELYTSVCKAWSYRDLTRPKFDQLVKMLAEGFSTRRGRRGAYLHRDIVNNKLRGKRGARLTALTNGGAIPDLFDYDVILQPEGHFIGTLNEDFAFESLPGDIFQLGNTSYRMLKIESGKVYVEDAHGQPPNIPFWFGEAPGRTDELSNAVMKLQQDFMLLDSEDTPTVCHWLESNYDLDTIAAKQLAEYLIAAKAALTRLPAKDTVIFERFFDEAGDMHFVIHSGYGTRINRAWGLALRKRFCRQFNFELQAAATDNSIVLSLGPTHSFPLDDVKNYLHSNNVRHILIQALLDAPMFATQWRWNCNISLAVPRNRNGKRVPAQFQRSNAEDLIAVVFPEQLACLENIQGDRELPDHPLVQQTLSDCLNVTMDITGLENLLKQIEAGDINIHCCDLTGPSVLCGEILAARPYAFLDDAPAEERRTQNVNRTRHNNAQDAKELRTINPEAIKLVKQQAWPDYRNADELYDALSLAGFMLEHELDQQAQTWLNELIQHNRVCRIDKGKIWIVCAERLHEFLLIHPDAEQKNIIPVIESSEVNPEQALLQLASSRMECSGPISNIQLSRQFNLDLNTMDTVLARLEQQGFILQMQTGASNEMLWCERGLLARIHRYSIQHLRKQIQPVSPQAFMRFLFSWQHLDTPLDGSESLAAILEQLEGFAVPAASWEPHILRNRMQLYLPSDLDQLCNTGRFVWQRMQKTSATKNKRAGLLRNSAICLLPRRSRDLWMSSSETVPTKSSAAKEIEKILQHHGACFFDELLQESQLLPSQIEDALAELCALGLVSSDNFSGLRNLIRPQNKKRQRYRSTLRNQAHALENAGRWCLLQAKNRKPDSSEHIQYFARVFLKRYGIVFRKLLEREPFCPPWRDLLYEYRRMEARGEIRGGRFVEGMSGEQFALIEAVSPLRQWRDKSQPKITLINATDPLNLTGIITAGQRISAKPSNSILFKDGLVIAYTEKGQLTLLTELNSEQIWQVQTLIQRHHHPAKYQEHSQTKQLKN